MRKREYQHAERKENKFTKISWFLLKVHVWMKVDTRAGLGFSVEIAVGGRLCSANWDVMELRTHYPEIWHVAC